MSTHKTVDTVGHGDTTASAGAKKNPRPTYHDDPARSEIITNRSHRGIGGLVAVWPVICPPSPFRLPSAGR